MIRVSRDPTHPAVIFRIVLFARPAEIGPTATPRLGTLAWVVTLGAIAAHTEAIVRLMYHLGPYSIGLLEAISMLAWTLAVVACFISAEPRNRAIGAILLGLAAVAVWVLLERRQANAQARRAMSWLCVLIAVQGVVGAVQYETHLPTELVWVHVALASLSWLCVLWAIAAIGRPEPLRARKRAQIRASVVQPNH